MSPVWNTNNDPDHHLRKIEALMREKNWVDFAFTTNGQRVLSIEHPTLGQKKFDVAVKEMIRVAPEAFAPEDRNA